MSPRTVETIKAGIGVGISVWIAFMGISFLGGTKPPQDAQSVVFIGATMLGMIAMHMIQ